ncbi:MAG: hypothetical protein ACSLFF_06265 [Solirubrobacterales bacterium]
MNQPTYRVQILALAVFSIVLALLAVASWIWPEPLLAIVLAGLAAALAFSALRSS